MKSVGELTDAVTQLDKSTQKVIQSQKIRTRIFVAFGVALVMVFIAGFLIANSRISSNSNNIEKSLKADCQLAKDVAEAPLPTTGTLGRKIIKDFQDSYKAKCEQLYGPLNTPSPRPTVKPTVSPVAALRGNDGVTG